MIVLVLVSVWSVLLESIVRGWEYEMVVKRLTVRMTGIVIGTVCPRIGTDPVIVFVPVSASASVEVRSSSPAVLVLLVVLV